MADEFVETLVSFARELRTAGLPVGSGDVVTFCAAMEPLDPTDLMDLYWGGRATLVTRREQIPVYHEVFLRFFLDGPDDRPTKEKPFTLKHRQETRSVLDLPETEPGPERREDREARLGLVASDVGTLKHKAFAACTPEELAALRRIMRTVRLTPPRRRSRRTAPAPVGKRPDMRRTVREAMRTHGDPATLRWRRRRLRTRPLVLILDVSGSMADYSRALLQFAHVTSRAHRRRSRSSASAPGSPGSPASSSTGVPTRRWTGPPAPSSTGRAAPGSAPRSTRSPATGAGAAWAAAASW